MNRYPPPALRSALAADMRHFCRVIGNRLAGSPADRQAADYTARRFRELGLTNVRLLPFACKRWIPGGGRLQVLAPFRKSVPIQVITHTPATPAGGVEGDLAVLEPMQWENGLRRKGLAGRIGLFYGGFGESAERFRGLQNSGLKALLFCDTRLPMPWPIAEGMGEKFMGLVRKPMANLSMLDAYALIRGGARRVRLTTAGEIREAVSHNVVGEWPGTDPAGRVLIACAHLDSVAVGEGADDDAAGMAALFAAARLLRRAPRRHTLRFIGFGAEEQLSVGSTRYVQDQIKDLARVGFVCNLDSLGAAAGRSEAMCCGTPAFERYVRAVADRRLGLAQTVSGTSPYQDQFPFGARGIPGLWLRRMTHHEHYWYHHSVHNSLENCSIARLADMAVVAAALLGDLAGRRTWPFPRALAPGLRQQSAAFRRALFE